MSRLIPASLGEQSSSVVVIRCALCAFKHRVLVPSSYANLFVSGHQSAVISTSSNSSPVVSPSLSSSSSCVEKNSIPSLSLVGENLTAAPPTGNQFEFECPRCELIAFFSPTQLEDMVSNQKRELSIVPVSTSSQCAAIATANSRTPVMPACISLSISPYDSAAAYQLKAVLTPPALVLPSSNKSMSIEGGNRAFIDVIGLPNVITQLIIDYLIWYRSSADFHVGDWVDARDFRGKWYHAQVVSIDPRAQKILVKWEGFTDRWNTWISVHSSSLAASNTMVSTSIPLIISSGTAQSE